MSAGTGFAKSQSTPCAHVFPDGHARAGARCGSRILAFGTEFCSVHAPDRDHRSALKAGHIESELKKVSARQRRKPPVRFFREGWDSRPFRPVKDCARAFNVDVTTVYRWYAWVQHRDLEAELSEDWEPPPRPFPEGLWELSESDLSALTEDFVWFRDEYFRTERGEPWKTPAFQRRWLDRILYALVTGGRLVILSPPRHGKTELLIAFCAWLICRFPNIRIIWVGGNEELAKQSLEKVMDELENNDELIRDFCPPGGGFKPDKFGGKWSSQRFTVDTRTITGIKQPTMRAVGRGGRLRSQDTDFIVNDDIEDEKSTVQPMTREETRRWWTTGPDSRKEEHSALFYIGSRAHPDDLGGHLLENEEYDQVVEHAHDPACTIPQSPDHYDEHIECMLFPDLRSYRWLMQQKRSSETVGGAAIFDMLYQNLPSAEGFMPFTAEIIDPCLSKTYRIPQGVADLPKPLHPAGFKSEEVGAVNLVAGLDPSFSGFQASFLWGYQTRPELHMWMVDLENRPGGGIPNAYKIIQEWYEKFHCLHWVVEENLYHGGIVENEDIREFASKHGIRLEAWNTYRNKFDKRIGVTAMPSLFVEKQVTLPYGDPASIAKTDLYRKQLIYFDPNAPKNRNRTGYKNDLVMAGWFPMEVIRRAQQEFIAEMGVSMEGMPFTPDSWDQAPWDTDENMPAWAS